MRFLPRVNRVAPRPVGGLGDPFTLSAELAVSLVVFLGLGWLVDRWLGTQPLFMLLGVTFAVIANFVKLYYAYKLKMDQLEQERRQVAGR